MQLVMEMDSLSSLFLCFLPFLWLYLFDIPSLFFSFFFFAFATGASNIMYNIPCLVAFDKLSLY